MLTEESFIDFKCPYCGETVSFPEQDAGFARACHSCTESFVVPPRGGDTGQKLPLPLTTPRLALRRLAAGDWKDLLEFLPDEELFHYAAGAPMDEDQILSWLERDAQVKLTTPDQVFHLGITLRDGGKLIGYLGLQFTDPQRLQAQVPYIFLNRSFQRKGYAREALAALLGFCFRAIKLHRVAARCDSQDAAACSLFKQAGMRREGEFIKDIPGSNGWSNSVWYGILEEDYLAGANAPKA
jgi:[ribosomal protein S5]-alanine N-acetyltransferase